MTIVREIFTEQPSISVKLPIFSSKVQAGFPSPADDFIDGKLDINKLLIKHPSATFFVRVSGDSMIGAGIMDNDILVIDRSLEPVHGKIVVAVLGNEFTVKRLHRKDGKVMLLPENDAYAPIIFANEEQLEIWGVVSAVVREF